MQNYLNKPEWFFLCVALLFGVAMVFNVQILLQLDETAHFLRIYQISQGGLVGTRIANHAGGYLHANFQDLPLINVMFYIKSFQKIPGFYDFPNTVIYSPVNYLPHVFAFIIGRLFMISNMALIYLGRLVGLLTAVIIIFHLIKRMPLFKWTMVIIMLMPSVISTFSSLTADTMNIVLSIWFITIVLELAFAQNKIIAKKNIIELVIVYGLLCLCKPVYSCVIMLYFLIPSKKFHTLFEYWQVFFIICGVGFICLFVWNLSNASLFIPYGPWAIHANKTQQLNLILSHPAYIFTACASFLNNLLHGTIVTFSFSLPLDIVNLTSLQASHYYFLVKIYFLLLILSPLIQYEKIPLTLRQRALLLLCFIATLMLVFIACYIGFTKVGAQYVSGIQQRYFIPTFICFLLAYSCRAIKLNLRYQNYYILFLRVFVVLNMCYVNYNLS